MTEPLSIAAGVVGITVPALHGLRILLSDLQRIRDAPEVIERLKNHIQSIDLALGSLQGIQNEEWESLGRTVADEAVALITMCTRTCDRFRADLQRWTRHSQEGTLSWQDRVKMGFLKHDNILSMLEQLQTCKITISSVVSTATLYSSIRHSHDAKDIKKTISTREMEITAAIETTEEQIVAMEERLQQLEVAGSRQVGTQPSESEDSIIHVQTEDEQRALHASRKLLGKLLDKVHEDPAFKTVIETQDQSTHVTFGNQKSGLQIGVSNGNISGINFGAK